MDRLIQVILVIAIITVIAIPLGIWQARAKRKQIEKALPIVSRSMSARFMKDILSLAGFRSSLSVE